jgi:glycosyltransferase 2 family protein
MKLPANTIKLLQLTFGLGISGFCLWLALRHVPFSALAQALSQANYGWVFMAIMIQFLAVLTRAERWRVLLECRVSLADAFWGQGIGYLFTNVLPFRLGEPARIAALATRRQLPVAQVAATAVLERLLDVATIVLVLVIILLLMKVPVEVQRGGLFFGLAVIGALLFILGLVWQGERSQKMIQRWAEHFLPRYAHLITTRWQELLQGFTGLTRGTVAVRVVLWSLATWSCTIGMYWCVLRAFQPWVQLVEAAFMVVALALAVSVPSGPGFIGVFQWVGQQALVLPFGAKYAAANALAITMTAYLIYYLGTTILGIIALWWFGQSFAQFWQVIKARPLPSRDQPATASGPVEVKG